MVRVNFTHFRSLKTIAFALMLAAALNGQVWAQALSAATEKLFEAVHEGDLGQVQVSIAGGGDINGVNNWGITPIDVAADKGHFDIVHYLLQVRDLQAQNEKPVPVAAPATITPLTSAGSMAAPAPPAAPANGVLTAPVTTVEAPPPAPVAPAGPSPFDNNSPAASSPLPIIGAVRGQTPVQQASKAEQATVAPAKPAPAKKDEEGIWKNIQNFLNLDEEKPAIKKPARVVPPVKVKTAKATPPAPRAVLKDVPKPVARTVPKPTIPKAKPMPVAKAVPRVNPATINNEPPLVLKKVLPEVLRPTEPVEKVIKPAPVFKPAPVKSPPAPAVTSVARVTPVANTAKATVAEPAPKKPVQVGVTSRPGKPAEQNGIISKVMSIFSPSKDSKNKPDAPQKTAAAKTVKQDADSWSVKEVQQAKVVPKAPAKNAVRKVPEKNLRGTILSIGGQTTLGRKAPEKSSSPWYYSSCIDKRSGSILFCIEDLEWPQEIESHFLSDSIMYEGTRTIVRYDEGASSYYHTVFPSKSFTTIVNYFSQRYGEPTKKLNRSMAPLAQPRKPNPTVVWQSIAPVTNLVTTLEVRMYDDNRGGFPDTKRGAVYLYHEWSQSVFPQVSAVELMLLRAKEQTR